MGRRPGIGAALVKQIGGKGFDLSVGRAIDHGTALTPLLDQSAGGKKPEMMGERGRRISGAPLDLTDGQSLVAGPHEEAKHGEPRLGAAGGEAPCGFLDGELRRRCRMPMKIHETSYLVITAIVNPVG